MADYIFDSWKQLMTDFRQSVQKDLEEIHTQKQAVQQMKAEIFSRMDSGRYYRDPERIVISAPEIVIGNVDYSGDLIDGGGKVIVKGNNLSLEGVGSEGQVVTRAPRIRQTAVNPGIDGHENVVCDTSEVVTQACGIVIQSNNSKGAFSQGPVLVGERGGICIHADQNLQLSAATSCEGRKGNIDKTVKALDEQIKALEKHSDAKMQSVEKCLKGLKDLLAEEDKLNVEDGYKVRLNPKDLTGIQNKVDRLLPQLYQETIDFINSVSRLAEANRTKKQLTAEKESIGEVDAFRKNSTQAKMNLVSETINMSTLDGDGCLRTNQGAGVNIRTPQMDVNMTDMKSKLLKGGGLNLKAENVTISSLEPSDDGKEYKAKGNFKVYSKDISLVSMDYEKKDVDKPMIAKEATAGGKVSVTARKVAVNAISPKAIEYDDKGKADIEGKSSGRVDINAKNINLKSMDVDKEKLTDAKLAEGGQMTLVSEKMYVGATSKKAKSKKIQTVSEEIGTFADKTLEIQQGEGKALLQLDGNNVSLGGSKAQFYGETTINGTTEVKSELKAPKITGNTIEAKSSFKSPNISDGMAVGGAGGGGSLSAKLKVEEVNNEK